jgi:hypothetical protein
LCHAATAGAHRCKHGLHRFGFKAVALSQVVNHLTASRRESLHLSFTFNPLR